MYPGFIFALNKNHLTELSKDCTSANRYVDEIDSIAKNHSLITKSNLLKNAKFNQTACYDLEVFKLKLLSKRITEERIDHAILKSLNSDPRLIDYKKGKK